MTKSQLIELIQRRLPNKVHLQVIEKYLEIAYGQMLDALFASDESLMDQYSVIYYNVPVVSISGQESYSLLPAKIANLSGSGSGVRNIFTTSMDSKFAPMTRSSMDVLDGMEAIELDPIIPFITQNNIVRYIGLPVEIVNVNMSLVLSSAEIGDDSEILLPAGGDQQIIETVLNILLGQPAAKKSNDNTSNPV
jgi:hypothetical protein